MQVRQRPDANFGNTPAIDKSLNHMRGIISEDAVAMSAAAIATLTAVLGAKPKDVDKPKPDGAPTGIRFTKTKSKFWAAGTKSKTFLDLRESGDVKLSSDKALTIIGQSGDVTITGKSKVEITCDAHIKGTLHHRSLKAE